MSKEKNKNDLDKEFEAEFPDSKDWPDEKRTFYAWFFINKRMIERNEREPFDDDEIYLLKSRGVILI